MVLFAGGAALAQQPRPAPPAATTKSSDPDPAGGRVMYFQKPAGVTPAGNTDPAPAARQALPAIPAVTAAQPPETTSNKQPVVPVPPEVTQLPSRDKIFTMLDDVSLERVIIKTLRDQNPKIPADAKFPFEPPIVPPGTQFRAKTADYPPRQAVYEAGYVVHRRLHFEEKNTERYGWDLGFIQPFVSTAYFYKDVLLWPNSLASGFCSGFWDTGAGKCLPGSPVPYYLYPPGLTITGSVVEAGLITGVAFIIP